MKTFVGRAKVVGTPRTLRLYDRTRSDTAMNVLDAVFKYFEHRIPPSSPNPEEDVYNMRYRNRYFSLFVCRGVERRIRLCDALQL